jgi:hypothetical protein
MLDSDFGLGEGKREKFIQKHSFGINYINENTIEISYALPNKKKLQIKLSEEEMLLLKNYFSPSYEFTNGLFESVIEDTKEAFDVFLMLLKKQSLKKEIKTIDGEILNILIQNGNIDIPEIPLKVLNDLNSINEETREKIIKLIKEKFNLE